MTEENILKVLDAWKKDKNSVYLVDYYTMSGDIDCVNKINSLDNLMELMVKTPPQVERTWFIDGKEVV